MNELTISLNANDTLPMYEQIYNYIKKDIQNGVLSCGHRLPSTRALSSHLDVSPSTTQMAYDQLVSEGYIESVPCRGYFVCQLDGLYHLKSGTNEPLVYEDQHPEQFAYDFSPNGIALESFPFNAWRKVTRNVLTDDNKELFNIGAPQGEYEFRKTISEYLHQSRGVSCEPEQIIIGAGSDYLLMLLHQLLDPSLVIAMENPTYHQAYQTFTSLDRKVVPVELDRNGMSIHALLKSGASIAYVMPSHQFPLGIVMPIKRRGELLLWAAESKDRYIIEDDYDSEFRYKGKPIPALQGNDTLGKVIYLGTFSKAIAPAIRMSYMVLPKSLLARYRQKLKFYSSTVSRIDQTIVNSFIQQGYYERHLNKMRALYKNRHDTLLNALKSFEPYFTIEGDHAGIHLLLTARFPVKEAALIDAAKKYNIRVYPLSRYYIQSEPLSKTTVIIGYANISNDDILSGIKKLQKAWKPLLP